MLFAEFNFYKMTFINPASPLMYGIIELHDHIFFFLNMILFVVLFLILTTVRYFTYNENSKIDRFLVRQSVSSRFEWIRLNHGTTIEIIWTVIPSFILVLIAIPSFALLYATDELVDPALTIQVMGHQWYWSYEYNDLVVVDFKTKYINNSKEVSNEVAKKLFILASSLDLNIFLEKSKIFEFLADLNSTKLYKITSITNADWDIYLQSKYDLYKIKHNFLHGHEPSYTLKKYHEILTKLGVVSSSKAANLTPGSLALKKYHEILTKLGVVSSFKATTLVPDSNNFFVLKAAFNKNSANNNLFISFIDSSKLYKFVNISKNDWAAIIKTNENHKLLMKVATSLDFLGCGVSLVEKEVVHGSFAFDSYLKSEDDLKIGEQRLYETDFPLVLPKNTHIRFMITSEDVIHSWSVPALGIKVDAVPGRINHAHTFIKHSGMFYGQCSELCGVNHAFMPIQIIAFEPNMYYNYLRLVLLSK